MKPCCASGDQPMNTKEIIEKQKKYLFSCVATYYDEIRPELGMIRETAETLLFLTVPPVPGSWGSLPVRLGLTLGPTRWAYFGIAATALGLLPPWARRLYGGPGWVTTDLAAQLSVRGLRLLLNALPRNVRMGPMQREALRRTQALLAVA